MKLNVPNTLRAIPLARNWTPVGGGTPVGETPRGNVSCAEAAVETKAETKAARMTEPDLMASKLTLYATETPQNSSCDRR
jgi:hypothetical protein